MAKLTRFLIDKTEPHEKEIFVWDGGLVDQKPCELGQKRRRDVMSEDSDHEPALNRRVDDTTDRSPNSASIQRYGADIRC